MKTAGNGGFLCQENDANDDGLRDLVCKILTVEMELAEGETRAILIAETEDGTTVRGEDQVEVVQP